MTRGPGSHAALREIVTTSPEATEAAGRSVGAVLEVGDLLALEGELGAGKTCFVRGVVEGLGGAASEVRSPTFVLHQVHRCRELTLHHVDLYRLGAGADLGFLDLPLLLDSGVVVIEWAGLADLADLQPTMLTIAAGFRDTRRLLLGTSAPGRIARALGRCG